MDTKKSALKVNEGVEQPASVNRAAIEKLKARKKGLREDSYYINGIIQKDRTILSQAITLIESSLPSHREKAIRILEACLPHTGNSLRIGITGVPGAGKSTFIEAFGKYLTQNGYRLAIVAIDPSSSRSKGSILGDKTRMESLSTDENAYIRPSPSSGSLGGVARKTYETMLLCEAAAYDVILVETVGVGQSETEAHNMVDFLLLLMLAGAGDELQGIKRGIIEMCDAIVINKADGDNISAATRAKAEYQNALHLFPPTEAKWEPKTLTCSSLYNQGIPEVWEMIQSYEKLTKENKYFHKNREQQQITRLHQNISNELISGFFENKTLKKKLKELEVLIQQKKMDVYAASDSIMNTYLEQFSK